MTHYRYINKSDKKFSYLWIFIENFSLFILSLGLSHLTACAKPFIDPPSDPPFRIHVQRYGNAGSFDLVTWNIKEFPCQQETTVGNLAQIIRDIDVDLIGLQEINDPGAFHRLLDSLPGYAGILSALPADGLKLGILYKPEIIALSTPKQIFTDDNYAFPRPPLLTFVEIRIQDSVVFDFSLIILHLKAQSDSASMQRRRSACEKLKNYIDQYLLPGADKDVVILGDLNDQWDDPDSVNVFTVFRTDTVHYSFLTSALIGQASYIDGFHSLIDHILISADARPEFNNGNIQIMKLDQEVPDYINLISDHRPVLAQFFLPAD